VGPPSPALRAGFGGQAHAKVSTEARSAKVDC